MCRTDGPHLRRDNKTGSGKYSMVFRAPLTLRLDPGSEARGRVSVAVKLALRKCGAHEMLRREAMLCYAFPRRMMEDRVRPIPARPGASVVSDGRVDWPTRVLLLEECGEDAKTCSTTATSSPGTLARTVASCMSASARGGLPPELGLRAQHHRLARPTLCSAQTAVFERAKLQDHRLLVGARRSRQPSPVCNLASCDACVG
ncbi:hypothetical protein BC628DRAFT_957052 [Trametes gibbosa]|nr:hypothetical protein BC628DRAFT_957052 [Trametes gibbosa]